jgi:hypothetical protein
LRRPGLRLCVSPPLSIVTDIYIYCQSKLFPLQISLYYTHLDVNNSMNVSLLALPPWLVPLGVYSFQVADTRTLHGSALSDTISSLGTDP